MGFKKFRIIEDEGGLVIHPDDVEAFLEYDRRPLTEEELAHIKHCREVYESMKPRVRGGTYAFYNDESVWVSNAKPNEDKALIVHNPDSDNPRAEWVKYVDLIWTDQSDEP